uniref:Uncharacterized protein n=1 Tax=Anguilla anguilla TaxID=7936 RepID=A0A0E9PNM0_ANGAN
MPDLRNLGYESLSINLYTIFWASSKQIGVGAITLILIVSLVWWSMLISLDALV